MARPSKPAETPEVLNRVPSPCTTALDSPVSLCFLPKPRATILPRDLPVASSVAPGPRPSSTPLHLDGPLIHNRSVEEYQQIYHQVVDDMLRFVLSKIDLMIITFSNHFTFSLNLFHV